MLYSLIKGIFYSVLVFIVLFVFPSTLLLAQQARKTFNPSEGGSLSITNSLGDTITLSVPIFALYEAVEITITEISDSPANPIAAVTFPGVKIEPSDLVFSRPVKLEIKPTDSSRDLNQSTLFKLVSSAKVTFFETEVEEGGAISASLFSTSTYLGGQITQEELEEQSALNTVPPEPHSIRDALETITPLEGFMHLNETLGNNDYARQIGLGILGRIVTDYNHILGQPIPQDKCGRYIQELHVLRHILSDKLMPYLNHLDETMENLINENSDANESEIAAMMETLVIQDFGSQDMFAKLQDISKKLMDRMHSIGESCPPLQSWKAVIDKTNKGAIDLFSVCKCSAHSKLEGEVNLLVDHTLNGSASGPEEATIHECGDERCGCAIGVYKIESKKYSVFGALDNEKAEIMVGFKREEFMRFKPDCWCDHPITDPYATFLPGNFAVFYISFPPENAGTVKVEDPHGYGTSTITMTKK